MPKRRKHRVADWPHPRDRFLDQVVAAFKRRRKALRYAGVRFRFWSPDDPFEWLEASWATCARRPLDTVVQLLERNTTHVYLVDQSATRRGKILFRLEDVRVVGNGPLVVRTVEKSIRVSWERADVGVIREKLRLSWEAIALSAL